MSANTAHFCYIPVIIYGYNLVVIHGTGRVTEACLCVTRRYANIRPESSEAEFKGFLTIHR